MKALQWGRPRILGRLSHPIGKRQILFLSDAPGSEELEELRRMHIRYVIWNNDPVPKALENIALEEERINGYAVISLPK